MSSVASALSSNGAEGVASSAKSAATGYASSSAQQWLSQFGTARVQLNVDDNGNWDDSAIDFLAPLYDNKKSMLFTQLGLRAPDGRVTGNMGMGVRTFYVEDWMFGGNVFFDDDFTGKNRRIGMGAEAWTNNLKLSANTYVGTTEWHQSRDFNDYNEKPADGYDVRAEGYLPAYPQLGAKLMYEQYYGDKVALFDTDHLQSNPSAVTTGLSYTPIPLVQLAVNYKRGQDSLDDTQFQVNFRYDLGRPWAYQVDPESVRLERSLAGSRYDLVERNNQIVLQYKKKDQQTVSNLSLQVTVDNSPSDGLTPNSAQVYATDKDGQPVRNAPIVWSTTGSAKFATPNAVTNDSGIAAVNFTNTVPEAVQITAKSGAASASQNSQFNAVTVSNITLKITKDGSIADGKTPNHAVATVTDINNRPIANSQVKWGVDAPATLKSTQTTTNASGQVTTDFTSTTAGAVMLTATAGDKSASQQGHFIANSASNVIDTMVVTKDGSAANGTTANTVNITVKDGNGVPVSNANVSLSADKGTVIFGAALKAKATKAAKTFQTDAQGSLTVAFTDTVAETTKLTATLENGNAKTTTAHFVADTASAKVSVLTVTTGAVANGTATNQATVTVVDANNNKLPGVNVTWTQDGAAVLGTSAKTDANGQTTVTFTDITAQTVNITAKASSSDTGLTKPSTFVADSASAKVSDLTVTTGALANGTATNQATVTVVDAKNNKLSGVDVTWTQDGSAVFGTSAKTDANGQTTVTFTDITAQTVNITAKASSSDTGLTKPSTFVADSASAKVSDLTVTTGALANGTATNQATVTVVDAKNNKLSGVDVTWTQDGAAVFGTSAKTDANGQTTVTFTDITAQTVNITAKASSSDAGMSKPSTFVADSASAKVSVLTVTTGAVANGTATNQATVTVVDANNNPLSGVDVTWTQDGSAVFGTSAKTDANGQTTVTFTDTTAQTVNITAKASSSDAGMSKPSTFVADSASAKVSVLTVTTGAVANGTATNQATVTVVDANNNKLPGVNVTWTQDGAAVLGTSAKTDANGQTTVTFTDTTAQTVNITAKASSSDAGMSKPSTFVADVSTAKLLSLTVTKDGSSINANETNTAETIVVDAYNNPLAGQSVQWSSDKSTVVITPDNAGISDASGKVTVSYSDTVAESLTLTATVNGSSLNKPSSFVDDAVISTISPTTNNALGDGSQTNEVTVVIKRSTGALLAGKNIHWSVNSSTASLQDNPTASGPDGSSSVKLTNTEGETVTVTATLDNGQTTSTTVTFTKVLVLSLTPTSASGPGGYQNQLTVTAKVQDKHGQPVSDVTVDWNTGSSDLAVKSSTGNSTDSSGQAIFQFESRTAQAFTPQASIQSGSTTVSKSTSLSFTEDDTAPIVYSVTPSGTTLSQSDLSGGFAFVVQPWKGMVKGQDIDCQYNYSGGRISNDITVTDDNWGKATTLITQAFPSGDAPTTGQRFCGYLTLKGTLGQRSAQTTVNVSR